MNIDELVEGFGRRMTKQGDNGVMLPIDAKHVCRVWLEKKVENDLSALKLEFAYFVAANKQS